ncbi:hypothetical protein ACFWCF_02095 [Rhodococcus sp. NPDC060090]|uniref:hypothetical protein n=1 Tax=Rhodococcus sp. NPDC060090 TaxID=3347056 RepID=UPI003658C4E8
MALLDADGDDPVQLWFCDVDADLEVTLTLLDFLDLMGVEIHAICLGELVGAGVALLTAADMRTQRITARRVSNCGHKVVSSRRMVSISCC